MRGYKLSRGRRTKGGQEQKIIRLRGTFFIAQCILCRSAFAIATSQPGMSKTNAKLKKNNIGPKNIASKCFVCQRQTASRSSRQLQQPFQQQQSKDTSQPVSQSSSSSRSLKHKVVNEFHPLFVVRHKTKLKNNVLPSAKEY